MSFNWPSSPGSLFWPPDACLLPHNDNNNSTDNNHLHSSAVSFGLLMPASCLTQQVLYKPSISWPEVARWAITGIYWESIKHMDLNWNEERVHLIQLWSQIWHLRQLDPRTCCPSLADNDHPSSSWNNALLCAPQSCHWSGNLFLSLESFFTIRNRFFLPRQSLPRPYPPVSFLVWQSWRDGELACWISGGKRWPNCQSISWLDF